MKDREDSTAGFKQVFLVYVDQKLKSGRGGRGHISLTEVDKWVLIRSRSLISVFSKESNIHAVLPGDTE